MTDLRTQIAQDAAAGPPNVSFAKDIAPLFNTVDIAHMKKATQGSLDLSNYDDVKVYAQQIYNRVKAGTMPPYPADPWTPQMVQLFASWMSQGEKP